ncbi:hypothetical protein DICPUDRAFT_33583 [Dictyostelium purpureum]|uniref:N-acetyltransferase domain-containing protein n=1 Tax=Dictyostelium purpureum TaxID=5786 RepID=F0ZL43_DICPU|nr:uncharacterized protein DICPUDRAFT_33583 [Dictyostelium purpureum]EGC35327.1 hypothetical protein DICPUDRAFT_33583 [Dictyostelium purpureum]|eukprot:XP_003288134.1 hypothetical protein DICPUDRAFT_33583 [Dictyostelium purpureum]
MSPQPQYLLNPIDYTQATQLLIILKNKGFHHLFRYENQVQCQNTLNLVDNEADPSIVLLIDIYRGQFNIYPLNSQVLTEFLDKIDWENGFLTPYKNHPNINWEEIYNRVGINRVGIDRHFKKTERVVFAGLLKENESYCIESLRKYFDQVRIDDEIFDSLVLPITNVQETINELKKNLDGNESLLTIEDAEKVSKYHLWKYKSDESINFLRLACSSNISGAYRVKNENGEWELASWIIHYTDGSIGSLYTDDKYRGKGYAKKVSSFIIIKMLENGYTQPYCYINIDNAASQKAMRGLGFQPATLTKWVIASKTN